MTLNGHRLPYKESTRYRQCLPRSCYRLRIHDPWGFELADGKYRLVVDGKRLAESRIELTETKSIFFGCDNPCTDAEMVSFLCIDVTSSWNHIAYPCYSTSDLPRLTRMIRCPEVLIFILIYFLKLKIWQLVN